nr:endo alpha-1,4 polygalactosaminidase [Pseudonocardia kujensis]
MASRFDLCRDKGCDGVEADDVDGWADDSGFDLTAEDQPTSNRLVARLAHERSLTIGLKNDLDQVAELVRVHPRAPRRDGATGALPVRPLPLTPNVC